MAGRSGRQSAASLAALAFGRKQANEFRDAAHLSRVLSERSDGDIVYRPQDPSAPFVSRLAVAQTEKAVIIANAMPAARVHCAHGSESGFFLIPLQGAGYAKSGRHRMEWSEGRRAIFLTGEASDSESLARSVIGIHVERDSLERLAATMVGGEMDEPTWSLDLSGPRGLDLAVGGVRFDQILRQHMTLLEALGGNGAKATQSGLEDMILRALVMMTAPDRFFADDSSRPAIGRRKLSDLCDHIDAHLAERLTLSRLEAFSGLSARSLQYAFRSAFGCSPMQWITERRLLAVRQALLAAEPGQTVSAIASPYFPNLGEFARLYRERYGELPSKTLAK